jgi:hypothetical protein
MSSNVKCQAEALITDLHPILRSTNAESFCQKLLPQLLKSQSTDDQRFIELWQQSQQSLKPEQGVSFQLNVDGRTKSWGEVASVIEQAFDHCTSELSAAEAGSDNIAHANDSWNSGSFENFDLDPSICIGDETSPLRLCVCKRCSRVLLQRRFQAHWMECKNTDYSQIRSTPGMFGASRDGKSPVNPAGAIAAAGKVKQQKNSVKHGTGPAKFVAGGSRANGATTERDRKRRKAEEELECVPEFRSVIGGVSSHHRLIERCIRRIENALNMLVV